MYGVTFKLNTKTKTLLVQGKAVDHTRDVLLQTIQADKNQIPVESPDQTNNTHFAVKHTTGVHQEGLMSPTAVHDSRNDNALVTLWDVVSERENKSESESERFEDAQLASNSSEVAINNIGENFSHEIAKIWSEISGIESRLFQKGIQPFLIEISKILIEKVFVTILLNKTGPVVRSKCFVD